MKRAHPKAKDPHGEPDPYARDDARIISLKPRSDENAARSPVAASLGWQVLQEIERLLDDHFR